MNDKLSSDLASLKLDRDAAPPRSPWVARLAIAALLVAAAVVGWIFGMPYLESRVFKSEVEATQIISVSPAQAQIQLTSTGYAVPQRVSKIGAKIPGRIAKIHVREGDKVRAGDVIAELDDADHKAAARTANSRVLAAQARVQTARADLVEAKRKAKQERALVDKGVAPRSGLEDLEARVVSLGKQVRAEAANVRASRAEADSLDVNLNYLTIVSPIDGTVVAKPSEPGELVGQMAASIAEIADFDSLVIETDVPESRLNLVTLGGPCEIVLDAFPAERHRGTVREVSPRVDRAKATVTVKVAFVDGAARALPNMAARVSFLSEELNAEDMQAPAKVVVPAAAIADRQGAKVVFVLEDDVIRMRSVSLGEAVGTGFELLDGPGVGTKVVREPGDDLVDGQRVKQRGET